MILRFTFETVAGALCIIALMLFGVKGSLAFAVFAFLPIIMRMKKITFDERELILFYKSGNYSLGGTIAVVLILYYSWQVTTLNGTPLSEIWMPLVISGIIFVRGLTGLLIFKFG